MARFFFLPPSQRNLSRVLNVSCLDEIVLLRDDKSGPGIRVDAEMVSPLHGGLKLWDDLATQGNFRVSQTEGSKKADWGGRMTIKGHFKPSVYANEEERYQQALSVAEQCTQPDVSTILQGFCPFCCVLFSGIAKFVCT